MANRTDPAAKSVHGTNPQNLVEKILRSKIYQNPYWKEQCFGLTAETLVDKAMELDHFGGTFGGNRKATPFMCLTMKMLQIQPEKEIVVEFIKNEDYKYVRILGAFYLRLVGKPTDVYQYLEPLYNDYRKLRYKRPDGNTGFTLSHVDEFIDELLTKDYSCDVALPRVPKRWTLEAAGQLEPRRSALEDDFEEEEEKDEEDHMLGLDTLALDKDHRRGRSSPRDRDRDARKRDSYRQHRDRNHDRDYDYDRGRGRERDRDRDRDRDYHRDRDRGRDDRDSLRDRDRDYYRRERDKERERHYWDRERRHSRSRSRSRSRDRRDRDHDMVDYKKRHRSLSPQNHRRTDKDALEAEHRNGRDEPRRKKERKEKKEPAADGTDHPDPEIAEANRLRAALGLKPLK